MQVLIEREDRTGIVARKFSVNGIIRVVLPQSV